MLRNAKDLAALRARCHTTLLDDGYGSVHPDSDGDLFFKCEARSYCLVFDEGDPSYLRVLFPNFWSIDSADEEERARAAAEEVSSSCKCTRVLIKNENAWVLVETLVTDVDSADGALVRRLVSMAQTAVAVFVEHMRAGAKS